MIGLIIQTYLQLSDDEKLLLLKEVDRWRPWKSLDDERLCLGCGRVITGHEIEPKSREGAKEAHCPTEGCQSIPLDWILPNPRWREIAS
jgi:hypothetical protein